MTWAALIPIIAQYGLVVGEKLWQLWSNNAAPSQTDWDTLRVLASTRAVDQMRMAISRAGLDPDSDEGKALIAAATTNI